MSERDAEPDADREEQPGERPAERPAAAPGANRESLAALLGGREGALDASLPPLAFLCGWLLSGNSVGIGAFAAVAVAVVLGVFRFCRGERPRAVLLSLLFVVAAALVALYTGRAADFFLIRLLTNVASALAWAASIAVRWPLLGVVVGLALGQRSRWRRDPQLLRMYSLASWIWVGQYLVRVLVFGTFWLLDWTVPLGIAQVVLTWPLVGVCIAGSAVVVARALPADHPGFRHPRV